jgi:hypothetical protein
MRSTITNTSSTAVCDHLRQLESEVHEADKQDAILWRCRSRVKWLSVGDAPSKYFFLQLKAKHSKDTIRALQVADRELTEETEILAAVQADYQAIYANNPEVTHNHREQQEVFNLIPRQVTEAQNGRILAVPDDEEIQKVVFSIKSKKSPGLDGITGEMLRSCWDFVGPQCCQLVVILGGQKAYSSHVGCGHQTHPQRWQPIASQEVETHLIA